MIRNDDDDGLATGESGATPLFSHKRDGMKKGRKKGFNHQQSQGDSQGSSAAGRNALGIKRKKKKKYEILLRAFSLSLILMFF